MARGHRRKCKCCLKLFRPDPRNRRHQRYCSAPRRRAASKAASQARDFRGPVHVARVRRWRSGRSVPGRRSNRLAGRSKVMLEEPPER
jgi:hypothetical protein